MIDRDRYAFKRAPTATALESQWAAQVPSGKEVESFFLDELCESSEREYFLCVSDVFLDAIRHQKISDQVLSLSIIGGRLLDAAEFARGVADQELVKHFEAAVSGFVDLYGATVQNAGLGAESQQIQSTYLALQALSMGDLPLARLILYCRRELVCTNDDCDSDGCIQCPACKSAIVPYDFHQRYHNMRNSEGHPS